MAKHPHRFALIRKKTWKCTIPGCSYFVHAGLVHLLDGKIALCPDCDENYSVDERALRYAESHDGVVRCLECRGDGHSADCGIYDGAECTCK